MGFRTSVCVSASVSVASVSSVNQGPFKQSCIKSFLQSSVSPCHTQAAPG